jgi:hypothetical protein
LLGRRISDLVRELESSCPHDLPGKRRQEYLSGRRCVPLGVAIFLRFSVNIAVLERRLARARQARRSDAS